MRYGVVGRGIHRSDKAGQRSSGGALLGWFRFGMFRQFRFGRERCVEVVQGPVGRGSLGWIRTILARKGRARQSRSGNKRQGSESFGSRD